MRKGLAGALVILGFGACYTPTQITVAVSTNVPCGSVTGTAFWTGAPGALGGSPTTATITCTSEPENIGSLVLVPSGSRSEALAITVATGVGVPPESCIDGGPKCIVARRRLRYIPHEPLRLPILMSQACLGVPCPGDQTCVEGVCRQATIPDPSGCEGPGCDETTLPSPANPTPDGGAPVDAGLDAGSDAGIDAGSDAGPTTPVAILTGAALNGSNTYLLANDGTSLFWIDSGSSPPGGLGQCTLPACTSPKQVIAGQFMRVAVSGGSVYWLNSNNSSVTSCNPAACLPGPGIAGNTFEHFVDFVTDGAKVFVAASGSSKIYEGAVGTAYDTSAGPLPATVIPGSPVLNVTSIALAGTTLVWGTQTSLVSCEVTNCAGAVHVLPGNVVDPEFIVTSGTTAYFTEHGDGNTVNGSVKSCVLPLCTGGPTLLATGTPSTMALAVDATHVYWVEQGRSDQPNGVVRRCALPACAGGPLTLASGQAAPQGITLTATDVYWSNRGTSGVVTSAAALMRMAKPPP